MVEDATVLIRAEDVKKASDALNAVLNILNIVKGTSGFGINSINKITACKIDPAFRESADHVADAIHKAILIFVQKFALPDTEESVIKRGGAMLIEAFNDLNDLENYYKEIANKGRLPRKPWWGRDISRFNDAARIDQPFIKIIQAVEQARTGKKPGESQIDAMLRKRKIF